MMFKKCKQVLSLTESTVLCEAGTLNLTESTVLCEWYTKPHWEYSAV